MSQASPDYARAPIAEALLDVRVADLEPSVLEQLAAYDDAAYPTRSEQTVKEVEVSSGARAAAAKVERKLSGYMWTSNDGRNMVQMRTDGFACGQLAPYSGWEAFYGEARRLWLAYTGRVGHFQLMRASLRYVNQIQVAVEGLDVSDYLTTRPEVAQDLSYPVAGFFMGIDISLDDLNASARLVETVLPCESVDNSYRLVLDIDVVRTFNQALSSNDCDIETFDATFDDLHKAKNHVFETSISDKTRELLR